MKLLLCLLALASLAVMGCSRSSAQTTAADEPVPAATYKAQRGIQLSPVALQTIGVQAGDVTSRDVNDVKNAPAVPATAVLRTIKGDFVYVKNGGWFLRTPVTLGVSDGAWLEIKTGLYEGDAVVTQGTRGIWLAELQAINGGVGCADGH